MREFIENEYLIPSLMIGIPEDVFWDKNPKSLEIYFKAYQKRREVEDKRTVQMMWKMGDYVRAALMTSVVPVGFIKDGHSLPQYLKCPYTEETQQEEMTEEQLKAERLRCYYYFSNFGKKKDGGKQ